MRARVQFFRYVVVGFGSNLVLYLVYLLLTYLGIGHKVTMTGLYCLGILQTFVFNRNWSFRHAGRVPAAMFRYLVAYGAGYVLNLTALMLLVDRWGLPHEVVQGFLVLAVAVLLFLAQRYWVFRAGPVPCHNPVSIPTSPQAEEAHGARRRVDAATPRNNIEGSTQ